MGKRITITITKAWDNSPDRTFYLEQKLCLVPSSFLGFSTLAPMQEAFPCAFTFLKITLPTLFSYIKTFDKCISCVFKDYLFFERCLETQTNKTVMKRWMPFLSVTIILLDFTQTLYLRFNRNSAHIYLGQVPLLL